MGENIEKNFVMLNTKSPTDGKQKVVTALRARFDDKCWGDGKYVEKHKLDKTTFSKLMNRRVTGKNLKDENSTTGKIIKQLKADGIWVGKLPWEEKDESKGVSKTN